MSAFSGQVLVRRSTLLVVSLCLCACTPATVKVWPASGAPVGGDILVQVGDSLYGIATRNGVSVADLAQANGIAEPFLIHPGDRLRLPANASPKAPVANAPAPTSAPTVRTEALPESAATAKPKPANRSAAKPPVATGKPVRCRDIQGDPVERDHVESCDGYHHRDEKRRHRHVGLAMARKRRTGERTGAQ
ncbi:MAG TPA: LysM peptidoglycan-binding domain-containing protein [Lysobacter sp.]